MLRNLTCFIAVIFLFLMNATVYADDYCRWLLEIDNNLWSFYEKNNDLKQLSLQSNGIDAATLMNSDRIAYVPSIPYEGADVPAMIIIDKYGKSLREFPKGSLLGGLVLNIKHEKNKFFIRAHTNPWYGVMGVIDENASEISSLATGTGFSISRNGEIADICDPSSTPSICVNENEVYVLNKGEFMGNLMWTDDHKLLAVMGDDSFSLLVLRIEHKGKEITAKKERTIPIPTSLPADVKDNFRTDVQILRLLGNIFIDLRIGSRRSSGNPGENVYRYDDGRLTEVKQGQKIYNLVSKIVNGQMDVEVSKGEVKKAKILDYQCEGKYEGDDKSKGNDKSKKEH